MRRVRVYGSSDVGAVLGNQQKRLHCCLPCRRIAVALRQLGDVVAGIAQRAQLTAIAPRDRIKEGSGTFLCCSSG